MSISIESVHLGEVTVLVPEVYEEPMGKLKRVTLGRALVVAVDIRQGSPTLGQWHAVEVSAENRKQVWAPAKFARGFCVLSDAAEVQYECTGTYNERGQSGILRRDPDIRVSWPIADPLLSEKDATARTLADWMASPESDHFLYGSG